MEEPSKYCENCKKDIPAANYASHSAFCERRIKLCKHCNEPVCHTEIEQHEQECQSVDSCSLCEEEFEKWQLPKHMEMCPKRLVVCEICEGEFPVDRLIQHKDFCGSRTEKCKTCKKFVMLKEKDKHMKDHLEQKILREGSGDVEVKQNCINEIITNSNVAKTHNPSQLSCSEKQFTQHSKDYSNKTDDHLSDIGACASPGKSEKFEISKYYGVCVSCNQKIRWVDMNTHVPSCASAAGKCSRCGDFVSDRNIKKHVLKECRMLKQSQEKSNSATQREFTRTVDNDHLEAQAEAKTEDKFCPFCKCRFEDDEILNHISMCPKNMYKCPLCGAEMPEKDKNMHESFKCKVLIQANFSGSSRNTASYADVTKEIAHRDTKHAAASHESYKYNKGGIKTCKFCHQEIACADEKHHLENCKPLSDSTFEVRHTHNLSFESKGAVPRCGRYTLPDIKTCKYCDTSYNAHLFPHHEENCLHKCRTCPACEESVRINDAEQHVACCHSKPSRGRGKKNRGKSTSAEKNTKPGLFSRVLSGLSDKSPWNSNKGQNANVADEYFSKYHDQNGLIPCEFCGAPFPMDEIVIHETGCNPELVSYAPRKTDENSEKLKTPSHVNSSNKFSHRNVAMRSIEDKNVFNMSRQNEFLQESGVQKSFDCGRNLELNTQPGEFLAFQKEEKQLSKFATSENKSRITMSSESLDIDKSFRNHLNEEAMEENSELPDMQACWNSTDEPYLEDSLHKNNLKDLDPEVKGDKLHDAVVETKNNDLNIDISSSSISEEELMEYINFMEYGALKPSSVGNEANHNDAVNDPQIAECVKSSCACTIKELVSSNCEKVEEMETSDSETTVPGDNEAKKCLSECCPCYTSGNFSAETNTNDSVIEKSSRTNSAFWKSPA